MVWVLAGILTAIRDTKFIMASNICCSWILGVLPLYLFLKIFDNNPSLIWAMTACYAFANLLCLIEAKQKLLKVQTY